MRGRDLGMPRYYWLLTFLVKRMRREKGNNEEVDILNVSPEPSVCGGKQSDDELEAEPEVFSRTL